MLTRIPAKRSPKLNTCNSDVADLSCTQTRGIKSTSRLTTLDQSNRITAERKRITRVAIKDQWPTLAVVSRASMQHQTIISAKISNPRIVTVAVLSTKRS